MTEQTSGRLSPIQLAKFFQALQGPVEWRQQAAIRTAGVHFGDYHLAIRGDLRLPDLERAWCQVVAQEPLLRTSFDASIVDRPAQEVRRDVAAAVQVLDWSGLDAPGRLAELAAFRHRESDRGFDLGVPPLARLTLARVAPGLHWLVMAAHEVILDNHSIMLLFDRLLRSYDGDFPSGPPAGSGYLDYADALRQQGIDPAQQFWTAALQGFRRPVQIGRDADDSTPETRASKQTEPLRMDDRLNAQIAERSGALGVAPESVLYAAFSLALSRYSGEADVVIGLDTPGREHDQGLAGMAGPFRNTVPLRVCLDEEETAASLLRRVDSARQAVTRHEYIPEPLIREWSDPSLARAWLYAHVVTLQEPAGALHQPDGLQAEAVPFPGSWQPRPLALSLRRREARFDGEVVFCTTMIGEQVARRFARHLAAIAGGLVTRPTARLRYIGMLGEDEKARILGDWNSTAGPVPAVRIEELIRRRARSRPDDIAVRGVQGSLSYGQLLERAAGWAATLRRAGAGPGDLAGVHMGRTPDLVAALLGVFLAGAAYVPLDPAYPRPRLAAMAQDAGLRAVLDDTGLAPGGLFGAQPLITEPGPAAGFSPGAPVGAPELRAEDLAYVLYTSGSTGRPKGVEIRHANAVNMISWAVATLGEDLAAFLATTSINFDCSILELFATLSAGGTVILADRPLSGATLREAAGATIVNGVPSVVAEALTGADLPPSVRTVILGGEAPWPGLVERIRASGQVRRILNLYGPTETTSYSTIAEIGATVAHPPSIGRPITNTQTYVLDRYLNLVPAGVTGELYIGGAGVARGYLGLPELTRERFIPGTVPGSPGGRLYRTGDLVRYSEEGDLLFLGRADTQVKVHGVRIETGEVEHVLTTLDGVAEAVVLAEHGDNGQAALAAWVTPASGACLATDGIRGRLREVLPTAMIPARIFVVDDLPRTPNGKVDRQELRTRNQARATAPAPPRTPLERWLVDLWSGLLAIEQVGVTDDFFELGGDSFVAMRMIGSAQEQGHPVEPADIYVAPTVASFAALIAARSARAEPGRSDSAGVGTRQ